MEKVESVITEWPRSRAEPSVLGILAARSKECLRMTYLFKHLPTSL